MSSARNAYFPGSRLIRVALGLTSGVFAAGFASYRIATYGQTFHAFDDSTDPLAQSKIAEAFNPHGNRTLSDIYLARVPLDRIDSALIRSDGKENSTLVERYTAGLLGGWAYATQRAISAWKADDGNSASSKQLYHKAQIDQSRFDEGTSICDELVVIEKTPSSILFRGGSPPNSKGLKEIDVLLQAIAEFDPQTNEVFFRLKCMFYSGQSQGAQPPLPEFLMPLHLMYARAMAANGVANCKK